MRRGLTTLCVLLAVWPGLANGVGVGAQNGAPHLRFAVIGDFGTGSAGQMQLARVIADTHARSPFDFVLTAGDNIYGGWSAPAVAARFEQPYKPLLDTGVPFFASLGNHDGASSRFYPLFNMHGARYYLVSRAGADFFALDSSYMDPAQLAWLRQQLANSTAPWRIAFFHHPLYSSGERHGSAVDLREVLEPIFERYGVRVVFSGHDHVYERITPQHGISYFVCGSSGQLRRGNLASDSPLTAARFDRDEVFLSVNIEGDQLSFSAISGSGATVDAGSIGR